MSKFKFTKTAVQQLQPPLRDREYHSDDQIAGLLVAVFTTGRKVFYLYRKIDGRPERIRLGEFPAITVEMARKKARSIIGEVANGKNPARMRRQLRAENTFGELFHWYIERAKTRKRSWQKDQANFDHFLQKPARRKLSQLDTKDFEEIHKDITSSGRGTTANRVLALASGIFGEAYKAGVWRGDNPCKGIARNKENKRRRYLRGDELRSFLAAVEEDTNANMRDYVMLSMLTGARRSNVQTMRWDEIRFDLGEWHIPAEKAKGDESLTLPLVPAALSILHGRRESATSEFVFPSEREGKHGVFQGIGKRWARILSRAGITNLRPHDLRHTFATWQVNTGASLSVIGATLGHQSTATTARYAHVDLDPVRASVERATSALLAEGKSKNSASVVSMPRARVADKTTG